MPADSENLVEFLPFESPLNFPQMLSFLALHAVPGAEEFHSGRYSRCAQIGQDRGGVRVSAGPQDCLQLELPTSLAAHREHLIARARTLFDLDLCPERVRLHLAKDSLLAPELSFGSPVRVPGCWDPFEAAVRTIIGQHVSVRAAGVFSARLLAASGGPPFPDPSQLLHVDLAAIGLTKERQKTVDRFARAVLDRSVRLDAGPPKQSLSQVLGELQSVPGIGPWTANYIAMRCLSFADAFPASDLALRRAASPNGNLISARALELRAERWRPFRAYAAVALWQKYLRGKGWDPQ